MKILAPINSYNEIKQLIEAGADELYCGVLSKEWKTDYTNVGSINRREFALSNMRSFEELEKSVKIAHSFDVPIFLTMNGLYTEEQYPLVIKEIKKALNSGVDYLIIADTGLLLQLKELDLKIKIQLSTGATVFNSKIIDFYKKKFGICKFVIPRQVTIDEIKNLIKNNIKLDVFIMNTRCMNEDGFCTFQHGVNEIIHPTFGQFLKKAKFDYFISKALKKIPRKFSEQLMKKDILGSTSACHLNYDVSSLKEVNKKIEKNIASNFGLKYFPNHCGACALYDFKKIGVNAVKIVGRQNPIKKKVKDVKFLKGLLDYLDKNQDRKGFYRKCKEDFARVYSYKCNVSQCYYH